MGANLVGNEQHWAVPALGWRLHHTSTGLQGAMAVARHARCHPRCWARYDSPGHFDKSPRCGHSYHGTSSWLHSHHGCTSMRTKQDRTGTDQSRHQRQRIKYLAGLVLGWSDTESGHLYWLFQVLSQRTAQQAIITAYLGKGDLICIFLSAFMNIDLRYIMIGIIGHQRSGKN